MRNVLCLFGKNSPIFKINSKNYNIVLADAYLWAEGKFLLRIFRNIDVLVYWSLADWKYDMQQYDMIIFGDTVATFSFVRFITKYYKGRCILFFWNKIYGKKMQEQMEIAKKNGIEVWSYNIEDCRKYGMNYNRQCSCRKLFNNDNADILFDLTFVGVCNKDRLNSIKHMQNVAKQQELRLFLFVVGKEDIDNNQYRGKRMHYNEYLEKVKNGRGILDLVSDSNYGLTRRPIEAMFFRKKLVTNYQNIMQYDFYNRNNIFILGKDNISRLKDFLELPYQDIDENIVNSYDVNEWIERF